MKRILFTLCLATAAFAGAQAQTAPAEKPAANPNAAKFQFTGPETHDFGTIKQGPVAEHIFTFKNSGKEPLIIQSASASCGCTTPEWPKEPILPGKTGKITVHYNTQGRPGPFNKVVYISSNAATEKDRYELYIKGTVEAEATPAATPAKAN